MIFRPARNDPDLNRDPTMHMKHRHSLFAAFAGLALAGAGCQTMPTATPVNAPLPKELKKVSLPTYVIETPDVLVVDTLRVVPLPPYRIEAMDTIILNVTGTIPNEPISGAYIVDPNGKVNLGFSYGSVPVAGLTMDEAAAAIDRYLREVRKLAGPQVSIALGQSRPMQQIRGEHIVRQDGTISLGLYGQVYVNGMTLTEVKQAIEEQLSQFLVKPEVSVDVASYNSKIYYIVTDGGGFGKQIFRVPVTGNETVLDALGLINGTPAVAARNCAWIARPAPAGLGGKQILPVDLVAITEDGSTTTNYQLLPGDRLFIKADRLIAFDNMLTKVLTPVNRVFGSLLLGSFSVNAAQGRLFNNNTTTTTTTTTGP
jgi:polysaccharide export outer membrane protein